MASAVGYLLDTNILVSLIRADNLGKSIDQRFGLRSSMTRSMICIVTAGEMLSLARQFAWGQAKRDQLQALLREVVTVDIDHPEILDAYGEIDHQSRASGRTMGKNDVWIAATAKAVNVPLLTTDFDHLHGTFLERILIPRTGA